MRNCCGYNRGSCEQLTDRISGLEARMATSQTHAGAQQEQMRMAGIVIKQLRANLTNPPPPLRAAFQKPWTDGGAFKALTKYTGHHSEFYDWSFSAGRVLTSCIGFLDRSKKLRRTMCLSTGERQTSAQQT